MPITTEDFPSLTDDLQEIFDEEAKAAVADMVGQKVFKVQDTDRKTYDYLTVHGISVIERVAEGSDLPIASSQESDSATWTQKRYGGIVPITKDMRMFDLHDAIEGRARAAATDAFDKVDQSLADVLTNGWATSYTDVYDDTETSTTPDGLALFSTVHSNNINSATFRNQIKDSAATENPALDRDPIVTAIKDARVHLDPLGHVRPVRLDTLLVTPTNADLADRLILTDKLPGSMDNDTNTHVRGSIRNIIVWERLETDGQSTSRSNYWFMYDSRKIGEVLKALFAEKPELDPPDVVYRNKNWEYSVDYYYSIGRGYPAYLWGSQGDNT